MSRSTRRILQWLALGGLLLVVCLRMTVNEPINGGAASNSIGAFSILYDGAYRFPGPSEIIGISILVLALAGIGLLGWGRLAVGRALSLLIIAGIVGLALASCFRAANRFAALVGCFDLAMALLGGWLASLLCATDQRRRFVTAVLVGLLAVLCAKGFYQRFYEIPATIHYFHQKEAAWLAHAGLDAHSTELKLFVSRLNSREVSGFQSLSDVFAEALLPLLLAACALGVAVLMTARRSIPNPVARNRSVGRPEGNPGPHGQRGSERVRTARDRFLIGREIPLPILLGALLLVLFVLGAVVLIFTRSKGSIATLALCLPALFFAWWARRWIAGHRWQTVGVVFAGIAVIVSGVLTYGLIRHTLPTRDLRFRWQYWTGAARIIRRHPLLGVGLYNFGYYYTTYKPRGAPEDVQDPHNPFVCLAAETGLPAAGLWAVLLSLALLRTMRRDHTDADPKNDGSIPPWWFAVFVLCWWGGRFLFTGPKTSHAMIVLFIVFMSIFYAMAAFAGMLIADRAWGILSPQKRRIVALAAVLGAAGMCVYDQINMALVTGGAAMLFWVVLGAFEARPQGLVHATESDICQDTGAPGFKKILSRLGHRFNVRLPPIKARPQLPPDLPVPVPPRAKFSEKTHSGPAKSWRRRSSPVVLLAALLMIGAALLGGFLLPAVQQRAFAWDPVREQKAYQAAVREHNWPGALHALNRILRRDRRSQAWLLRRIWLKVRMGINPRADVLALLRINRTDARVRIPLARTARCGLTPTERIHQLKLALALNHRLPRRELTRLTPDQIARIRQIIQRLQRRLHQ